QRPTSVRPAIAARPLAGSDCATSNVVSPPTQLFTQWIGDVICDWILGVRKLQQTLNAKTHSSHSVCWCPIVQDSKWMDALEMINIWAECVIALYWLAY